MVDPILTEGKKRKRWGKPKGLWILVNKPRNQVQTDGSEGCDVCEGEAKGGGKKHKVRGYLGGWWVRGGVRAEQ